MSGAWVASRPFRTSSWSADGPSIDDPGPLADPARDCRARTSRFCRPITRSRRAALVRAGTSSSSAIRRGAFLVRVGEHADVVERVVADELAQLVDVRVGLAREADDERGAERDAGHARRGSASSSASYCLPRARAASSA